LKVLGILLNFENSRSERKRKGKGRTPPPTPLSEEAGYLLKSTSRKYRVRMDLF
jgi:hypothetical protein